MSRPSVSMELGARVAPAGVYFTLHAPRATRVWLLLFERPEKDKPWREIELRPARHLQGGLWHVFVRGAHAGQCYVYRLEGIAGTDPQQWLLDPYARAVAGAPRWGDSGGVNPGERPKKGPAFPKGIIVADDFDWADDRPPATPLSETVIYEAHLRGFTADPSAGSAHPGTYRGFMEKIPHLQKLGVTAVEFLPLHEFNEMEFLWENGRRGDLRNLWGYSPLAYFAPNGRYAAAGNRGGQVREFKELVRALHRAGIEVILDVVFNHTAELDETGPTLSFRGIDRPVYYQMEPDGRGDRNFTGCGNTLNANQPVVQDLILACLRHWVLEYHVDGFRFDLASTLTRGTDGQPLSRPPVLARIEQDPVLQPCKLIAEAWDAAGLYQVGRFPARRFSEWNGRYRDDLRLFWLQGRGHLGALATRLAGSSDLYEHDGQSPLKSINYITCHDGFTLQDLVSYSTRHNKANKDDNRDGETQNFSRNFGVEGPAADPDICARRRRMQKNMLATLFLSTGVPMLLAGDEMGRTQGGNNNAYCQDNAVSWLDWRLLEENRDLFDFTRRLIRLRRRHPVLRQARFFSPEDGRIEWRGPDGQPPDWQNGWALACLLRGDRTLTGCDRADDSFFLIFNSGPDGVSFRLPPPQGQPWEIVLYSRDAAPEMSQTDVRLALESVAVLASRRKKRPPLSH